MEVRHKGPPPPASPGRAWVRVWRAGIPEEPGTPSSPGQAG